MGLLSCHSFVRNIARFVVGIAIFTMAAGCAAQSHQKVTGRFYVSPVGKDTWSGTLPSANARGTDGPFATLDAARLAVRKLHDRKDLREPVEVQIRGGTYALSEPLVFSPEDSGTSGCPVIYRAYEDEKPVISGGKKITGWKRDSGGRWKATVEGVDNSRQFYVNGVRARRTRGARPPGLKHFGSTKPLSAPAGYTTTDGGMVKWRNQGDIEFGYYYPIFSHKILKVGYVRPGEEGSAIIEMAQPWFWLGSTCDYLGSARGRLPDYMENAFELLAEPGQWYLDRSADEVYYIPMPGEDMATAETVIAVLETLVELKGTLDRPVHDIQFKGLTFAHATWLRPSRRGHLDVQANFTARMDNMLNGSSVHGAWLRSPANIQLTAAKGIRFDECTFTKFGGAGIDIQHGSQNNVISLCRFHDISASGVQVGDVQPEDHHPEDERLIVKDNRIVNCYVHHVGVEYEDSVGVFAGYTDGTVIAHNEISHLPYTGVSVGWGWGNPDPGGVKGSTAPWVVYKTPTTSRNNRIEYNHIHHVMLKRTDGGGIYTLGNQPGSVIRGNHVHDNKNFTGGIYLDNGSRYIEVAGNLVYNMPRPRADKSPKPNWHGNHIGRPPGDKAETRKLISGIIEEAGIERQYRQRILQD